MDVEIPQAGNQVFAGAFDGLRDIQFGVGALNGHYLVAVEDHGPIFTNAVDGVDDGNVRDCRSARCRLACGQEYQDQTPDAQSHIHNITYLRSDPGPDSTF